MRTDRVSTNIHVRPDVLELAEVGGNRSECFEKSVEICRSIYAICHEKRSGNVTAVEAYNRIDELAELWHRLTQETLPFK